MTTKEKIRDTIIIILLLAAGLGAVYYVIEHVLPYYVGF